MISWNKDPHAKAAQILWRIAMHLDEIILEKDINVKDKRLRAISTEMKDIINGINFGQANKYKI